MTVMGFDSDGNATCVYAPGEKQVKKCSERM